MWPLLLDMTKEESIQHLRHLELEAYAHLVSALRAQGPLNPDKRKLLKETSVLLNITQDRHKAEIRRAVSDEKLNTIAFHISGETVSSDDWVQEGRRCIPLLPRMAPQTAYSAIADEVAEVANQNNKDLPSPSSTERKRQPIQPTQQTLSVDNSKPSLRLPETPKIEESKKRKLPVCTENSSLAQHLLGPSKISKIQQIYRQKTKAKSREQLHLKYKQEEKQDILPQRPAIQHPLAAHKLHQLSRASPSSLMSSSASKINVLQNISIHSPVIHEETEEQTLSDSVTVTTPKQTDQNSTASAVPSNDTQTPRPKLLCNLKPNTNITFKPVSSSVPSVIPATNGDVPKTVKMTVCPSRKALPKPIVTAGQKLIVVTNSQSMPTTSILQRTLTIPFMKNISVKNIEKFKIVTSSPTPSSTVQVSTLANPNTLSSMKHKVVTVRTTNQTKKVIPLSQLQMLNPKAGIKVLPLGSKIVCKTSTSTTSSPLYVMNTTNTQTSTQNTSTSSLVPVSKTQEWPSFSALNVTEVQPNASGNNETILPNASKENGKSSALEDILKTSGVISGEKYQIKATENPGDSNEVTEYSPRADGTQQNENVEICTLNENIVTTKDNISKDETEGITEPTEPDVKEFIESEVSVSIQESDVSYVPAEESQDLNMDEPINSELCDDVLMKVDTDNS